MAKPAKVQRGDSTLYRVQIRRPTKGIHIDRYFPVKRDALDFIRRVEGDLAAGRPVSANTRYVGSFTDAMEAYTASTEFKADPKGRPLKPSALKDRQQRTEWLARECFGPTRLKSVTARHIVAKLDGAAEARGWSPATRYRYESALSRFMDYCLVQGWIATNPMRGMRRNNDTGTRRRVYTGEEWQRLLAAADDRGDMLGMFLRLSWATGSRKGELQKLRWVDIRPFDASRHPSMRRAHHESLDGGARISVRDPKNREDRVVFIRKQLYGLVQCHEQQFRQEGSPLVFPGPTGNAWRSIEAFATARKTAGLGLPDEEFGEVLTIHHIRHTWATRLADGGATLAQLMSAGGWKTPQMAARYFKIKEEQAAEAALLLSV